MIERLNMLVVSALTRAQREEGQAVVEYALILGLVVVGAVLLLKTIGGAVSTDLTNLTSVL